MPELGGHKGGAMRLCFIGDSFVNGTGDPDCLGWVGRICAAARRRGHDLTAYNLGVRRDTSADIAARWQEEALRRLPAGMDGRLVFSFGANDCFVEASAPRVALTQSLANARAILDAARRWRPTRMLGPPPLTMNGAGARICDLSRAFADLASELDIPYFDLFTPLSAMPLWHKEIAAGDGAHPGAAGYALIAELVEQWPAWRRWFP